MMDLILNYFMSYLKWYDKIVKCFRIEAGNLDLLTVTKVQRH